MNDYFNVRSFGATGDGATNDAAKIQAAINALPTGGGVVYFPPGTYKITSTLTLPDKSVTVEFAPGSKLTVSGGIPAFTIPNGLTTIRNYGFMNPSVIMTGAAGQEFLRIADASGFAIVVVENPYIFKPETLVNFTATDMTFTNFHRVAFRNGRIIPNAGASTLAKTPNPAGTYSSDVILNFDQCEFLDFSIFTTQSWAFDIDADLILNNNALIAIAGGARCDGCLVVGGFIAVPSGDFTIYGWSFTGPDGFHNVYFNGGDATARIVCLYFDFTAVGSRLNTLALKLSGGQRIVDCIFSGNLGSPTTGIEVIGDYATISGSKFDSFGTQDILLNGAKSCTITGCVFANTGGVKTIVEAGAADKNMVSGCTGISTGGGFTVVGANTLLAAGTVNVA